MNETEQGPWVRDSYTDVGFDGREGEFLARIACARHVETGERLVLSEIIPRLNALEKQVASGKVGSNGIAHQNGHFSTSPNGHFSTAPNGHFDTAQHGHFDTAQHGRLGRIRQALYDAGIDWNTTTAKLAACDWVTETYIEEHVTAADPDFLGLAIQRMLDGLPPPIPVKERRQQAALKRYPHIRR